VLGRLRSKNDTHAMTGNQCSAQQNVHGARLMLCILSRHSGDDNPQRCIPCTYRPLIHHRNIPCRSSCTAQSRKSSLKVPRTFCPSLDLGIVTVVQTMRTVMRNALLLVAAPRRLTTCAFSIELEDVLGWSVVFEQLGPHPLAKVVHCLCFLVCRWA